jgi:hypothetical protein
MSDKSGQGGDKPPEQPKKVEEPKKVEQQSQINSITQGPRSEMPSRDSHSDTEQRQITLLGSTRHPRSGAPSRDTRSDTRQRRLDSTASGAPSDSVLRRLDSTASGAPSDSVLRRLDSATSGAPSDSVLRRLDSATSGAPSDSVFRRLDSTASGTQSDAVNDLVESIVQQLNIQAEMETKELISIREAVDAKKALLISDQAKGKSNDDGETPSGQRQTSDVLVDYPGAIIIHGLPLESKEDRSPSDPTNENSNSDEEMQADSALANKISDGDNKIHNEQSETGGIWVDVPIDKSLLNPKIDLHREFTMRVFEQICKSYGITSDRVELGKIIDYHAVGKQWNHTIDGKDLTTEGIQEIISSIIDKGAKSLHYAARDAINLVDTVITNRERRVQTFREAEEYLRNSPDEGPSVLYDFFVAGPVNGLIDTLNAIPDLPLAGPNLLRRAIGKEPLKYPYEFRKLDYKSDYGYRVAGPASELGTQLALAYISGEAEASVLEGAIANSKVAPIIDVLASSKTVKLAQSYLRVNSLIQIGTDNYQAAQDIHTLTDDNASAEAKAQAQQRLAEFVLNLGVEEIGRANRTRSNLPHSADAGNTFESNTNRENRLNLPAELQRHLSSSEQSLLSQVGSKLKGLAERFVTEDEKEKFLTGNAKVREGIISRLSGELQEQALPALPEYQQALREAAYRVETLHGKLHPVTEQPYGHFGPVKFVKAQDPAGQLTDGLVAAVETKLDGTQYLHIFSIFEAKMKSNYRDLVREKASTDYFSIGQVERSLARLETGPITVDGHTYKQDEIVLGADRGDRTHWYLISPPDIRTPPGFQSILEAIQSQGRQVELVYSGFRASVFRELAAAFLSDLTSRR